jgi:pyruvate dehydrogenase E1 component alpha subunit
MQKPAKRIQDLAEPTSEDLLEMYTKMLRIRLFNDRQAEESKRGNIFGYVHLYTGMEAIAVGVISALQPGDKITSTHRAEGHFIAAGVSLNQLMAECFGRVDGVCGGRGGPMGLAAADSGVISAYEVVGGGIALATGIAWAFKKLGNRNAVVCFFGDGAANQGALYECLNMAGMWKLPVVYACENNGYAVDTSIERAFAVADIGVRAQGFGVPGVVVDGTDVIAVNEEASQALYRARAGEGPTFLELQALRWCGHHLADPQWYYRTREEVEEQKGKCPIERLRLMLLESGELDEEKLAGIHTQIENEVDEAVRFAEDSSWPDSRNLHRHLFADSRES